MSRVRALAVCAGGLLALAAIAQPLRNNLLNLRVSRSSGEPPERARLDRPSSACSSAVSRNSYLAAAFDLQRGCASHARNEFRSYLEIHPRDPMALTLLGDAEWQLHNRDGARSSWVAAGDFHRLLAAGSLLEHQVHLDEAERMYGAAVEARPTASEGYLALAALQWNHHRHDAAALTYETMIARHPSGMGEVPYVNLATTYAERRDFGRAVSLLGAGLQLWPRSTLLRTTLGMTYAWSGRSRLASDTLEAVLADDPAANDACFWLGWMRAREGNDSEAVRQYSSCLARNPNDPNSLYERGMALMRLRDLPAARADFKRVLAIAPNRLAALDRLRETEQAPGRGNGAQ